MHRIDLLYAQSRPTDILAYLRYARVYAGVSKETYNMAKETYSYGKRALFTLAYLRYAQVSNEA